MNRRNTGTHRAAVAAQNKRPAPNKGRAGRQPPPFCILFVYPQHTVFISFYIFVAIFFDLPLDMYSFCIIIFTNRTENQ
jgi:hypothetical protein